MMAEKQTGQQAPDRRTQRHSENPDITDEIAAANDEKQQDKAVLLEDLIDSDFQVRS
ncbi:MAG: hypothetical protein PVG22_18065 [Chromatiales bacterium]|jgi:hypothetical protein